MEKEKSGENSISEMSNKNKTKILIIRKIINANPENLGLELCRYLFSLNFRHPSLQDEV